MSSPKLPILISTVAAIAISVSTISAATITGDFDLDGGLGVGDVDILSVEISSGGNGPAFDVNGDATVDLQDLNNWVHNLSGTWFGDANLDGEFNTADIVQVFLSGKYNTGLTASWGEGDWNADLVFDIDDLAAASLDGGFEQGPSDGVGGGGDGFLPPEVFEGFGETPPQGVPDGGPTALLSLIALGAVGGMRRFVS